MDTIAVFWDYENVRTNTQGIKVPLAESIIEFVNKNGYPFVMKVYANWNIISNSDLIQGLYSCGFEPIEVPMEKTNSVDLKMAVDILDIAFEKSNINHFIIVTGDKDFIPVVNWLKSRRK